MNLHRHIRVIGAAAGLAVALASVGACGMMNAEARDQWKRSYTLAQGGTVEIRNTNGRIEITPGDGNAVDVVAERVVRAMTDEDARAALAKTEIAENISPDHIVLDSTKGGGGFGINVSRTVNYVVHVPRWANVKLNATNGDIEVRAIDGELSVATTNGRVTGTELANRVKVETTNGEVSIGMAKLADGGVSCETTNGAIEVSVPRGTHARVSASVTNGDIDTSGVDLAVSEKSRRRLEASMGGGGPEIRMSATNGQVRLAVR